MKNNSQILIGQVSGCFGVKGWLKVFSYSDPRENITTYKDWIIDGKLYESVQSKKNGKLIVAKLKDIDDKEAAQSFIGKNIEIKQSQLKKLDGQQYYWRDLIGLDVINTQGIKFGKVKNMLETGANDVMIIQASDRERLIPFILGNTVIKVDIKNGSMLVDWHEDD
jgi:16S rRNA processing protein RimM